MITGTFCHKNTVGGHSRKLNGLFHTSAQSIIFYLYIRSVTELVGLLLFYFSGERIRNLKSAHLGLYIQIT